MQVVVAFEESGAGGGDEGLEQSRRARDSRQAEAGRAKVGKKALQKPDLRANVSLES